MRTQCFNWSDWTLEERLTPANTPPVLLADINTAPMPSSPKNFCEVGGMLYFTALSGDTGYELYKSDGTSSGTVLVKDIYPGSISSSPSSLINHNGTLYFAANDGVKGNELWTSDGTSGGTKMLADLRPGLNSSNPAKLTSIGSGFAFTADNGTSGEELGFSDGTAANSKLIADLHPALGSGPNLLTNVGGRLAFIANDGTNGQELWTSDGVTASLFADVRPGSGSGGVANLVNANGTLYFTGSKISNEAVVWKANLAVPGSASEVFTEASNGVFFASNLANVGSTVFFRAYSAVGGYELYKTDGTSAGTVMVKDINPGSSASNVAKLIDVAGTLYFAANDGPHGIELWKSDGTSEGTVLVKDANPGTDQGHLGTPFNAGGTLYFTGNDGLTGGELWKSDGTVTGTGLVKNMVPGVGGSGLADLTAAANFVFFRGAEGTSGSQLCVTDGTVNGTGIVRVVNNQNLPSDASQYTQAGDAVYFVANSADRGFELWTSNGTSTGTVMVRDLRPASGDGLYASNTQNRYLATHLGRLFFNGVDGTDGPFPLQLWSTEGTADTTSLVADLPLSNTGFINSLISTGQVLYFHSNGFQRLLWRSDGTSAGTFALHSSVIPNVANGPVNTSGRLFFVGSTLGMSNHLWTSDGTTAGTRLVKNISASPNVRFLTNMNGITYFSATDFTSAALWRSDGTSSGTVRIGDTGFGTTAPSYLTNLNGQLIYRANTATHGNELWTTDGTSTGTRLLKDIRPGNLGSFISGIFVAGNNAYFTANDGSGVALWATDGTAAGTRKVHNVSPYSDNVNFKDYYANVGGILYFTAGSQGRELWRSDGTSAGTTAIDLENISAANPTSLLGVGNRLYFTGFTTTTNREPWTLTETDPLAAILSITTPSGGVVTTGQSVAFTLSFSEPVTLTGSMTLTLNTGATLTVTPFSGTSTTVTYTATAGETTPSLRIVGLAVNGTLRDATNQDAVRALPEMSFNLIVNPLAPTTVSGITVNPADGQRSRVTSITVTFPTAVNAATLNEPGAIVLRRSDGVSVSTGVAFPTRVNVSPSEGMVTSVTLSFVNINGGATPAVEYGSLSDGRWTVQIPYFNYVSPPFHRLFGDVNGDGQVDGPNDFSTFGFATASNSPFDWNADGTIDGPTDFAQFGSRFGRTV